MKSKIHEMTYDKETRGLVRKPLEYNLVKRGDKTFALVVGKEERGHVGIGDGQIVLDEFYPLEETPCENCGVYGLIGMPQIGRWTCLHCGNSVILSPKSMLHVRGPEEEPPMNEKHDELVEELDARLGDTHLGPKGRRALMEDFIARIGKAYADGMPLPGEKWRQQYGPKEVIIALRPTGTGEEA